MPQTESEVKEIVNSAVRRTVGIRALQIIHQLVDDADEEERFKKRAVKWIAFSLLLTLVALFVWGVFLNYHTNHASPSESTAVQAYAEQLTKQIERLANTNHIKELGANKVSGIAVLHISVIANGQLERVDLRKSSDNVLLDSAALRLVKIASPFPPFPEELRKQIDIFEVTRSFSFRKSDDILIIQ
jgi:TonB family protein